MSKKWVVAQEVPKEIKDKFPELSPVVLQLLYNRELTTQEQIDEFLNPDYGQDIHDPFLFKNMEKAVERIIEAITKRENIVVHGDYDADGVCSAALLTTTLRALGAKVEVFLPHREVEGYGLHQDTIRELAKKGTNLIVTTDCGISNKEEVSLAEELGIEVIITDHHMPPPEPPDRALAIINPNLEGEAYPFKKLAGVGVAFKMAQAILKIKNSKLKTQNQGGESFEKWLLDLVAIGTIGDCVPLLGENRTLVKYGLIVLNKTKRPGLKKLIEIAGLKGELESWNISFQIVPRLNAAARMKHAISAYKLLMTESEDEALELSKELNQINQDRQELAGFITREAKEQIGSVEDQKILIAQKKDWPLGLVGLIAGKIADEYHRPTIILAENNGVIEGSGRSIPEFNIIKALQESSQFFNKYGGHPGACGFTIKNQTVVEEFKNSLIKIAERELGKRELVPVLNIDTGIELEKIDWDLYDILKRFAPFGEGNQPPRYLASDVRVVNLTPVGQNGQHLRLMVNHQSGTVRKMIGFCLGNSDRTPINWCQKLKAGDRIDVVFEVGVNEWNGSRELQMKIVDLRKCDI